ncbi:MAG TPA: AAA domain-containing protein, partial [Chitinophagaceae bacterium]
LKHFIEVFDLYPYDIKAVYNKSSQIQYKFKKLQALLLELDILIKRSNEINDKINLSDLREFFKDYSPLINPEKESTVAEVKSRIKELSNKIWASRNFKKSETLLNTLLPNTFKNLGKIDARYLNSEAFEFCYAFQHLSKNALLDFQAIKEKLKYYFDKMTDTKADILFDLAKTKFHDKFDPLEMEDFLKILHNYKYNQSQAVRGIQQNAKFKSLVRKNGVDISQRLSCWVMKFNDVLNSLGHKPEVFDCVIVDEASQLDFNSVLLSYYAKNMIVVGDDKQTSPSGLSGVGQEELGVIVDKNLSFMGDERAHIRNDNSLFSLTKMVAGSSNLSLKEHFRCVPEIIAFSKDQFYPNSLRPLKQLHLNRLPPKVPIFVPDAFMENKIVMREIEGIKRYIIDLFNNPAYDEKTVGVVSLGLADHTDRLSLITEELYEIFAKEKIENHNLIIADAAKFQGDERDVMIISLGAALDIQKLSQNEEAKPARIRNDGQNLTDQLKSINVALSRAKEQMILFYSLKADQLKTGDFRIDIINFFKEKYSSVPELILPPNVPPTNRTRENTPPPFDSWFEYDIADLLIRK